jgi:hypothetical protein
VHEPGSALSAWESFYVIVGSSGGALIGLQFVVITLIADRRALATFGALSAFGTPTVVHFTNALVVSAIMSAPWPALGPLSVVLGIYGIAGLVYGAIVIRRARRQTDYKPVGEDWFWYAGLPCFIYALLTLTAVSLRRYPQPALFAVATSALTLLLIGIHNAWDTVTHIVMSSAQSQSDSPN